MESIAIVGQQTVASQPDLAQMVRIDYINYRGERSVRRVVPHRLYFGEVEWHPGTQWILDAWDVDKAAIRSFAVVDIRRWGV
jgi:predicted DNA-binding transcriptional regulator YafY